MRILAKIMVTIVDNLMKFYDRLDKEMDKVRKERNNGL